MPALGTTTLYRPPPSDFDRLFIEHGWSEIEALTNAHAKTIRKWLDLRNADRCGRGLQRLQDARTAWVARHGKALPPKRIAEGQPRRSASRYVSGRTSIGKTWPSPAPRFWELGMMPGVSLVVPARVRAKRVVLTPQRAAAMIETEAELVAPEVRMGMLKAAELLRAQAGREG